MYSSSRENILSRHQKIQTEVQIIDYAPKSNHSAKHLVLLEKCLFGEDFLLEDMKESGA